MFSSFDFKLEFYRDDLNHPTISGNKLHKLAPNLEFALANDFDSVVSFGGPYSNHLHALAWACKQAGLGSHGIIRGELHEQLTPTLKDCKSWGMQLSAINRKGYREIQTRLASSDQYFRAHEVLPDLLPTDIRDALVIPEGGSNLKAIDSLADVYQSIFREPKSQHPSHVVCATGTGATVAGLVKAAPSHVKVIGIQAVAEGDATMDRIRRWLGGDTEQLTILPGHLGGFAKTPIELLEFIVEFEQCYDIPLDPIYNGKVVFELMRLANENYFKNDDRVLVIHTGGLQGKRGIQL